MEKLPRSPLGDYFPDYAGGDNYDAACDYLLQRFVSLNQSAATKQIYAHYTCATDTQQIKCTFSHRFCVCISDLTSPLFSRVECYPRYPVTAASTRMWSSVIGVWIRRVIVHFLPFCMIYRPLISLFLILLATPLRMLSHCHLSDSSSLFHRLLAILTPLTLYTFNSVGNPPIGFSRHFPVRGGMFPPFRVSDELFLPHTGVRASFCCHPARLEPSLLPCFLNIPWMWRRASFPRISNL